MAEAKTILVVIVGDGPLFDSNALMEESWKSSVLPALNEFFNKYRKHPKASEDRKALADGICNTMFGPEGGNASAALCPDAAPKAFDILKQKGADYAAQAKVMHYSTFFGMYVEMLDSPEKKQKFLPTDFARGLGKLQGEYDSLKVIRIARKPEKTFYYPEQKLPSTYVEPLTQESGLLRDSADLHISQVFGMDKRGEEFLGDRFPESRHALPNLAGYKKVLVVGLEENSARLFGSTFKRFRDALFDAATEGSNVEALLIGKGGGEASCGQETLVPREETARKEGESEEFEEFEEIHLIRQLRVTTVYSDADAIAHVARCVIDTTDGDFVLVGHDE